MNPIISNANKLRWKFENLKEVDIVTEMSSFKISTGPLDWSILLFLENFSAESNNLIIYLFDVSSSEIDENFIYGLVGKSNILTQNGNAKPFRETLFQNVFSHRGMIPLHREIIAKDGTDSIIVDIDLSFQYYNFSKIIPDFTDITIIAEDKKFHVNKGFLCAHSEYFYNLFVVEKSKETELKFEDVSPLEFSTLLASSHFITTFSLNDDVPLISLAKRFGVPSLHRICEQLIISCGYMKLINKISCADKNDYEELMMNPIVKNGIKLRWKFEKIGGLDEEGMYNDKISTDLADWKIRIFTNSQNIFGIELLNDFGEKSGKNFIFEVDGEIRLWKKDRTDQKVLGSFQSVLCQKYSITRALDKWADIRRTYIKNDSLLIDLYINFHYYDFSKHIPNFTDLIIIAEETEFHVNKGFLCAHSEYFYNLFVVEDSKETELKLEDVPAWGFSVLLASPYLVFQIPDEFDYNLLINLARRFGVLSLHQKCEKFLISYDGLELVEYIRYADSNDYEELMTKCIEKLKSPEEVRQMVASPEFLELNPTTQLRITSRFFDFLMYML